MDERFMMHRLRSTRLAAVVGVIAMAMWLSYEFFAHEIFRWDLLAVLGAMAVTKWVAMLYYQKSD